MIFDKSVEFQSYANGNNLNNLASRVLNCPILKG